MTAITIDKAQIDALVTQMATDVSTLNGRIKSKADATTAVQTGDFAPVLNENAIKLAINKANASIRYGLSDSHPLDDSRNLFRGVTNKDAWSAENIGLGSVSFGRNGLSPAYLSATFGHDCATYGVASAAGGAGAGTGNPDVPTDGAKYGYCAFAWGKDTRAVGRISQAFGQDCEAGSIHSFCGGTESRAGAGLTTHPNQIGGNGVESTGESAFAFGYRAYAYGDFSVSLGSFVQAYNGSQVFGRGINPGSPLVNSLQNSMAFGYGVNVPTLILTQGDGATLGFGKFGVNTKNPKERLEFVIKDKDKVAIRSETGGGEFVLQGTLTNGSAANIFAINYTSPNGGQSYGQTTMSQNGS